jgi:pimeloyl-ACP methyl ester carboxylesterase
LVVIAVALVAGACDAATNAASTRLAWHTCDGKFRCATLSVPVSYSDPHGAQIPIAAVELVASQPNPSGDIVLNPGGPGESGVEFLEQAWSTFPASLRARFNLVSFDPRGVGSSHPLECLTKGKLIAWIGVNPSPVTQLQINGVVSASKAFVRGCEHSASRAFISSMSTANTARDMDRLRAGLGDAKLTYYGASYGTYLGTLYAEMFPTHTRALVLDGAIDPAIDPETMEAEQADGFETNLHDFLAWCASHSSCGSRFSPTPAKAYAALIARFKRGLVIPAHLSSTFGGQRPVNWGTALVGIAATLYSKTSWPYLGGALAAADAGDGTYLAGAAYGYAGFHSDGTYSNILSANMATVCLDRPAQMTISAYKALAARLAKSAPTLGASEAWGTLPCNYWPVRVRAHPAPAHAPGAPPILVIGTTHDPATPYAWAQALAKQLPHATLLTRTGSGHTGYRASSCIRTIADRYFESLKMPPAGTVCASD